MEPVYHRVLPKVSPSVTIIIITVFIKRKILSVETFLSACTDTHTHTHTHSQREREGGKPLFTQDAS